MSKHLVPVTYIKETIIPEVGQPECKYWRREEPPAAPPVRVAITQAGFGQARRAGKRWEQELTVQGGWVLDETCITSLIDATSITLFRRLTAQEPSAEPVSPPPPHPAPDIADGRETALQAIREQAEVIKTLSDYGAEILSSLEAEEASQMPAELPEPEPEPVPLAPEPAVLKRASRRVNRIPLAAGKLEPETKPKRSHHKKVNK